jgi:hypothetical protein
MPAMARFASDRPGISRAVKKISIRVTKITRTTNRAFVRAMRVLLPRQFTPIRLRAFPPRYPPSLLRRRKLPDPKPQQKTSRRKRKKRIISLAPSLFVHRCLAAEVPFSPR